MSMLLLLLLLLLAIFFVRVRPINRRAQAYFIEEHVRMYTDSRVGVL
jgi:hypothetical protein